MIRSIRPFYILRKKKQKQIHRRQSFSFLLFRPNIIKESKKASPFFSLCVLIVCQLFCGLFYWHNQLTLRINFNYIFSEFFFRYFIVL